MSYQAIMRVLGRYFLYFAAILLVPLAVSALYDFYLEPHLRLPTMATAAFAMTIGTALSAGGVFVFFGRGVSDELLRRKESILLVVVIWFLTAALASLPFLLTGALANPVDAYFEAMSGLTTTGATVIEAKAYDAATGAEIPSTMQNPLHSDTHYTFYGTIQPLRDSRTGAVVADGIEALGKPLLFWRSLLSWLGGIGVVVLFIAILPALAVGGKFLYETEVAGPSKEGLTPRIKETAAFLLTLYIALTAVSVVCLYLSDTSLPFFDLITLALGTISTGGYYCRDACLSVNLNVATSLVLMTFMIVGGMNFSLFFHLLKRRIYRLRDPELYAYLALLAVASVLLSGTLWAGAYPFGQAVYYGCFQAVSALTSTGYSFVDYDAWPIPGQLLLIVFMFIGGMSGSTAGGIKVIRYIIAWRTVINKIEAFFRPEVVRILKVGSREISEKTSSSVMTFFFLMLLFVVVGTCLLSLDSIDPLTALGIISSTINNSGLYFGGIGCTASLGFLSDYAKEVAILWMVLGRLEFLSLLVLLAPSFWRSQ